MATAPFDIVRLQAAASSSGAGGSLNTNGLATVSFQVTGTFVGTVFFEGTIDGTDWVAFQVAPVEGGAAVTSATAPGIWYGSCQPFAQCRARVAWTSGTSVTVYALATASPSGASVGGLQAGDTIDINQLFYSEDSITTHGRRLLPINLIVTADDQQIVGDPGAGLVIRLYRLNVQLRSGGAACEAGASFTTGGASVHDSVLTAAGQPGGWNAAPNYLEGGLNEGLYAVLSTGSSVRYTGLYELVDPSTEV